MAVLAVGAVVVVRAGGRQPGDRQRHDRVHLAGTDLAPDATATAFFTPTPAGLKILLDADGLAGADPDDMYEAWISDGQIRVSAGTFHLRNGHNPIELWAGTDDPRFHVITVTLEPIDGVAESSGQVVLKGEFSLPAAAPTPTAIRVSTSRTERRRAPTRPRPQQRVRADRWHRTGTSPGAPNRRP